MYLTEKSGLDCNECMWVEEKGKKKERDRTRRAWTTSYIPLGTGEECGSDAGLPKVDIACKSHAPPLSSRAESKIAADETETWRYGMPGYLARICEWAISVFAPFTPCRVLGRVRSMPMEPQIALLKLRSWRGTPRYKGPKYPCLSGRAWSGSVVDTTSSAQPARPPFSAIWDASGPDLGARANACAQSKEAGRKSSMQCPWRTRTLLPFGFPAGCPKKTRSCVENANC